ncbi:MAG: FAD-dependent oxidoreductase [Dehalococcoidia bacterium]|jgi:thioredoxin reductase (NADPH)|nr:FAD-dependent oxidoreductase [Dehalococcoidia bacterium]
MSEQAEVFDLVVIGAGAGGLTAAMYGARLGLKTVVLEGMMPGGQIINAEKIENFPGFPDGLLGADLAPLIEKQASAAGAEVRMFSEVESLESEEPYLSLSTPDGKFRARAVIAATGSGFADLGVDGEEEFRGRGVSNCATCDGAFFLDETVALVGGGDSALDEALSLTTYVSKVIMLVRSDEFTGQTLLQERVRDNDKIEIRFGQTVTEILGGDAGVNGVKVKDAATGEEPTLDVAGVFIFVGTEPRSSYLSGFVGLDGGGHVETDISMSTSSPGLYAVGDIRTGSARQLVTSAGDGATAAIEAHRYIESRSWPE